MSLATLLYCASVGHGQRYKATKHLPQFLRRHTVGYREHQAATNRHATTGTQPGFLNRRSDVRVISGAKIILDIRMNRAKKPQWRSKSCETKGVRRASDMAPVTLCHSKLFHMVAASAGSRNRAPKHTGVSGSDARPAPGGGTTRLPPPGPVAHGRCLSWRCRLGVARARLSARWDAAPRRP